MAIRYIFSTSGDYVAFVQQGYVFLPHAEWVGFVRLGNEVYARSGNFLGYLMEDDRVVGNGVERRWYTEQFPAEPDSPSPPQAPFRRLAMAPLPPALYDLFESGRLDLI